MTVIGLVNLYSFEAFFHVSNNGSVDDCLFAAFNFRIIRCLVKWMSDLNVFILSDVINARRVADIGNVFVVTPMNTVFRVQDRKIFNFPISDRKTAIFWPIRNFRFENPVFLCFFPIFFDFKSEFPMGNSFRSEIFDSFFPISNPDCVLRQTVELQYIQSRGSRAPFGTEPRMFPTCSSQTDCIPSTSRASFHSIQSGCTQWHGKSGREISRKNPAHRYTWTPDKART